MNNIIYPWATQFVANCKHQHGEGISERARRAILNNRPLNGVASYAFAWSETPQGWDYWHEIDTYIR